MTADKVVLEFCDKSLRDESIGSLICTIEIAGDMIGQFDWDLVRLDAEKIRRCCDPCAEATLRMLQIIDIFIAAKRALVQIRLDAGLSPGCAGKMPSQVERS